MSKMSITTEQFREQPIEVQKVFIDWWKSHVAIPHKRRVFIVNSSYGEAIPPFIEPFDGNYLKLEKDYIPLLTEGHLRKFIENKTNCKAIPNILGDTQFSIELYRLGERCFTEVKTYDHLGNDSLQAYWKIACEIAHTMASVKEEKENE